MARPKLNEDDLKKLQSHVKELNSGINALVEQHKNVLRLLASTLDETDDSIEIRAKRIILMVAGNYTLKPQDLKDSWNLKNNLQLGSNDLTALQMELIRLVKEYKATATITSEEIKGCKTVGDVIKLINGKIKP